MFTLEGGGLDPQQKRHLVDWTIRPALRGAAGGGRRERAGRLRPHLRGGAEPAAMAARGITTDALEHALRGEQRATTAPAACRTARRRCWSAPRRASQTLEDIRQIVLASRAEGGIVRVEDVAEVRFGTLPRNGVVAANGEGEAVWGMVLGLRGANARTVVDGREGAARRRSSPCCREGAEVVHLLRPQRADRKARLDRAEGAAGGDRAGAWCCWCCSSATSAPRSWSRCILPLAVLATFGVMRLYGLSANIMSLGGLAIAIGLLVDCAVVVVENIAHHLDQAGRRTSKARLRLTARGDARGARAAGRRRSSSSSPSSCRCCRCRGWKGGCSPRWR